MARPMKRPASASRAAGAAGKRARQADSTAARSAAVVKAVEAATGYPKEILRMLAASTKVALSKPEDVRHEFAKTSLGMVERVLRSVAEELGNKVGELEQVAGASGTERAAREAKVKETETTVSERTDGTKAAQAELDAASQGSAEAAEKLKVAKREQHDGDQALAATAEHKKKLEDVQSGSYAEAKEHPSAKAAKAFLRACGQLGLDHQLLRYAESSLAKAADERGTFDSLVARELDAAFEAAVAKAAEVLSAGEPAKAEREARAAAAAEAADARAKDRDAAKAALDEAKAAQAAAAAELRAAEKALKDLAPELRRHASELEAARRALEKWQGTVTTFEELRDRTTPPPPEPEPAEPEAEAEAEAPAAEAEAPAEEPAAAEAAVAA